MANAVYNCFKSEQWKKTHDLVNDTIKIALVTSSYSANIDSHSTYSDITNEVTGTGYSAGGATLGSKTVTQDNTNDRGVFDAADATWSASTITARGAVIYNSTNGNKLLCYIDFGADKSSSGTDFTIQFNASGIMYAA